MCIFKIFRYDMTPALTTVFAFYFVVFRVYSTEAIVKNLAKGAAKTVCQPSPANVQDTLTSTEGDVVSLATDVENPESYVSFKFNSRKSGANNDVSVKTGERDILLEAGFCASKHTKILIHGYIQNGSDTFSTTMTDAFLELKDLNILSVSWTKYAFSLYPVAVTAVPHVGAYTASFIDFLVQDVGVDICTIHVVGHSLGAHIAGVVGEHVSCGKLCRISGLDPAGPLFIGFSTKGRLDASDAKFVDVIHTALGTLGFIDPCGTVDFYPNGGYAPQPGCLIEPICSHQRSVSYYAESVSSEGFIATKCDSLLEHVTGRCVDKETAIMGYHVDRRVEGVFHLTTNADSPYAQFMEPSCLVSCELI